jgi:RNA polymerase sigma factor (sigma-70 family)
MLEDNELIRRYAEERSEDAFAELVQRHLPLVYSAALRRLAGDAHAAGDVTQLVFAALARQAHSLVHCRVLPGWLYATTRNVAVDFIRSEHRRRTREQEAYAMHELDSASPPPAWEQLRPLLDEVMDQLNRHDREAVLLRFFARRSFSEIGRSLDVTEDAARMRVDRALEKLRILLARRGATSACAALGLMLASQAATAAPPGIAATVASAALKSAASAASQSLNLIQLMSTTKTIAAAGVALALAIGFTIHEANRSHTAEASLTTGQRNLSGLREQVNRSQQRAAEAEELLAAARKGDAQRAAEEAQLSGEAEKVASKPDPIGTGRQFLAAHPETATMITGYAGTMVTVRYRELFKRLDLTPSQIEQFRSLSLQMEAGVRGYTSSQEPAVEINIGDLTRKQIENQIRELLGPSGYAQYEDLDRNLRGQTRQLAAQIVRGDYFSDAPLTTEQANRLTEIVAQNSPDFRQGRWVNVANLDWDKTLTEAASVLPARQLAALTDLREKNLFDQAMGQATNQAIKEAKAAAGLPSEN